MVEQKMIPVELLIDIFLISYQYVFTLVAIAAVIIKVIHDEIEYRKWSKEN